MGSGLKTDSISYGTGRAYRFDTEYVYRRDNHSAAYSPSAWTTGGTYDFRSSSSATDLPFALANKGQQQPRVYSFGSDSVPSGVDLSVVNACLANISSLRQFKNDENLSADTLKRVNEKLRAAEQIRRDSTLVVGERSAQALIDKAVALDEEAAELFVACQEEAINPDKKVDASGKKVAEDGDAGNGSADNGVSTKKTSVACEEGDTEMSDAELAKRYDLKMPMGKMISTQYAYSMIQSAGERESYSNALATYITDNNVVSFLVRMYNEENVFLANTEAFLCKIDGQSWAENDDEVSIREFLDILKAGIENLRAAKYITDEKADEYVATINNHRNKFLDEFDDDDRKDLVKYLNQLAAELSIEDKESAEKASVEGMPSIIKHRVAIGTQEWFEVSVKEKQAEEKEKAVEKYVEDYFEAVNQENESGQVQKGATISFELPSEVKYLPNKRVFQVKIEDKVFEGKDFKELNRNILNSRNESIIMAWGEIKEPKEKRSYDPMNH